MSEGEDRRGPVAAANDRDDDGAEAVDDEVRGPAGAARRGSLSDDVLAVGECRCRGWIGAGRDQIWTEDDAEKKERERGHNSSKGGYAAAVGPLGAI